MTPGQERSREVAALVRLLELLPGAITVTVSGGRSTHTFHIPPADEPPVVDASAVEPFVPTSFQEQILDALADKALRTDALAAKVGSRSRLFVNPGGLRELEAHGLVAHHKRLGFYRPDSPPEDLQSDQ